MVATHQRLFINIDNNQPLFEVLQRLLMYHQSNLLKNDIISNKYVVDAYFFSQLLLVYEAISSFKILHIINNESA
mgnify:CR=1 FL=1